VFVALGIIPLSWVGLADGVIANGTTMKVHSETYFIDQGNRWVKSGALKYIALQVYHLNLDSVNDEV